MSKAEGGVLQAQPSMTLSEINDLSQTKRFCVTALVEQTGDPRSTKYNRVMRVVKIIDQEDSCTKMHEATFTFCTDAKPNKKDSATIHTSRQSEGSGVPLTFCGLSEKKIQDGSSIETSQEFFVVKVIGNRAEKLPAGAQTLLATPAESRDVVQLAIFIGRSD